jgi:hypothetical protein
MLMLPVDRGVGRRQERVSSSRAYRLVSGLLHVRSSLPATIWSCSRRSSVWLRSDTYRPGKRKEERRSYEDEITRLQGQESNVY